MYERRACTLVSIPTMILHFPTLYFSWTHQCLSIQCFSIFLLSLSLTHIGVYTYHFSPFSNFLFLLHTLVSIPTIFLHFPNLYFSWTHQCLSIPCFSIFLLSISLGHIGVYIYHFSPFSYFLFLLDTLVSITYHFSPQSPAVTVGKL